MALVFDHIGLTVRDLDNSVKFFTGLGFEVFGEKPAYPAVFVRQGQTRLTLWQAKASERVVAFDRHNNIGLHHLALGVPDVAALEELHEKLLQYPGCEVEFGPELSGAGPDRHMMVAVAGSGIRIEFRVRG